MEHLYFWTLSALVGGTLIHGLVKTGRFFEYPYFMATAFAVFIIPQAVSLVRFPGAVNEEWLGNTLLMACFCFGMCSLGYRINVSLAEGARVTPPMLWQRLFLGSLVFIAISYYFNFLISRMMPEETGGSMWTGPVTIYGFFALLIYPAFAVCLRYAIETGRLIGWAATIVAALPPLQTALNGRREATVQFALTLCLTLFFARGMRPPRLAIAAVIGAAMLAIPATGTYRGLIAERDWKGLRQIDLIENFRVYLTQESILELRNGALLIEASAQAANYEWGTGYWDQLVFRFVPAQWFGDEFKQSLMFHSSDERLMEDLLVLGYEIPGGSTLTGIGDSFQQFGYFGCLFFAVLGVFFRSLWEATKRPNALVAQLFYIQISTSAMRAVTHQTVDFLPGVVYQAIFLGILALFARAPNTAANQTTPDARRHLRPLESI
jgi:hypothetical protein